MVVVTKRVAFAEIRRERIAYSFLPINPETWDGNQVPISSQGDRAREDTLCVHPDSVGLADR